MNTILAMDHTVLSFIATHLQSDLLTAVMRFFSMLGDYGLVWIALTLFLFVQRKTRRCGAAMALALLIGVVFGEGLIKNIVCRLRPFVQYSDLTALIAPPSGFSFPSSHTLSSFAAATVLFRTSRRAGAAGFVLAFAIAFSRLYLCVHFPTDVLAGIILGILNGVLSCFIVNRLLDKLHYTRLR